MTYEYIVEIKGKLYTICHCSYKEYSRFKRFHYLKTPINPSAKCFIISLNGEEVGFHASLYFPIKRKDGKKTYRGHRTVIRKKFRGQGIGTFITDFIAKNYVENGFAYYTKTTNKILGNHRNNSPLWRPTEHTMKHRNFGGGLGKNTYQKNVAFCHEFVGEKQG